MTKCAVLFQDPQTSNVSVIMNKDGSQIAVFANHHDAMAAAEREKPGRTYKIVNLDAVLAVAESLVPRNGGLSHAEITTAIDAVRKLTSN